MKHAATQGQRTGGAFRALSLAGVYDRLQDALGADGARRRVAQSYVLAAARRGAELRVLDVGCGTGALLRHLKGVAYVGVDANERYLARARARFGKGATFRLVDVARPDWSAAAGLGDALFDVVVLTGLLHHLGDASATRLFHDVAPLLAPEGRVVTLDGTITSDTQPAGALLARWDRGLHVRAPEEYRRLAAPCFGRVDVHIHHDLLRVPYSHVLLEASMPFRRAGAP